MIDTGRRMYRFSMISLMYHSLDFFVINIEINPNSGVKIEEEEVNVTDSPRCDGEKRS
jgi:hypothetical protein